jgi:hypothetical protein
MSEIGGKISVDLGLEVGVSAANLDAGGFLHSAASW